MIELTRMRTVRWLLIISLVLANSIFFPSVSRADQDAGAAYIVLGDSVEFGIGATELKGYVPQLNQYFGQNLGVPVKLHNLSQPGSTVRDIKKQQLAAAITEIENHRPASVIVSWGGGGNDLLQFILSPEAATCRQRPSCLGRVNALLNEVEQMADRTLRDLRAAVGPDGEILVRTQYNSLKKQGCATADRVDLASAALKGVPDTRLDEGLNDRLRKIAARYDATVIEIFGPFFVAADTLIAGDCVHPNDAGHAVILQAAITALTAN